MNMILFVKAETEVQKDGLLQYGSDGLELLTETRHFQIRL